MNNATQKAATPPKNIVKVKLDVIFKMVFAGDKELLRELLAAFLKLPSDSIKKIRIRNAEVLPDSITGKFVRMDINMEVGGKLINVEMQCGSEAYYKDRALLYWARLYSSGAKRGDDYSNLKQSINISIVNQPLFDCEEYHSCFTVMEQNRLEKLSDKCEIHFFEIPKISKTINKEDMAELWLQFINAETEEELEMLSETGVAPIQKAVATVRKMSEDERIQEIARMREKALSDEISALNAARRKGREEERKKQKTVIAKKDAELADAKKALVEKEKALAEKDDIIAKQEEELSALRAQK